MLNMPTRGRKSCRSFFIFCRKCPISSSRAAIRPRGGQDSSERYEVDSKMILDIKDKYKNESIANLYDKKLMPTFRKLGMC